MNSATARVSENGKGKKNTDSYTMLVERDSRRIRLDLLSHGGYNIYGLGDPGWRRLGGNPMAAAPDAFALRHPLWAGPNTYVGGGATTPITNTITIL
jgi:hypothetical protein